MRIDIIWMFVDTSNKTSEWCKTRDASDERRKINDFNPAKRKIRTSIRTKKTSVRATLSAIDSQNLTFWTIHNFQHQLHTNELQIQNDAILPQYAKFK